MAVQVVPVLKPLTVKLAGSASEALVSSLTTVPELQVRETLTLPALSGMKSLLTTNWALRRVLVIVHSPALSAAWQVPVES